MCTIGFFSLISAVGKGNLVDRSVCRLFGAFFFNCFSLMYLALAASEWPRLHSLMTRRSNNNLVFCVSGGLFCKCKNRFFSLV